MGPVLRLACAVVLLGGWAAPADELTLGERTVKGVFTGFGKGQFRFQAWDGQALAEKAMNVRKLALDKPVSVTLDTRSRKETETVLLKGYDSGQFRLVRAGRDAVERLEDLVERGKVTVVHFHPPDSVTSTRQGSYCRRLAKDSRGRVVYRRLALTGPDDPAVARFELATLPQFWFYSRSGKLVTRLTERFTPEDFEQALEAAKKGAAREDAE